MAKYHHTSEFCLKKAKYPITRQLTVLETVLNSVVKVRGAGINYVPVNLQPCLVLQGKWLHEAGFPIGQKVEVTAEKDRLVLTPFSVSSKA